MKLDAGEILMKYMAEMAESTCLIAAAGSSGHAVVCCSYIYVVIGGVRKQL